MEQFSEFSGYMCMEQESELEGTYCIKFVYEPPVGQVASSDLNMFLE
jgi:hypothetical protein